MGRFHWSIGFRGGVKFFCSVLSSELFVAPHDFEGPLRTECSKGFFSASKILACHPLTFGTLLFHVWQLLLTKRHVAFRVIEPSDGGNTVVDDISCFLKHQDLFVKKTLVTHAHVSANLPFQLWLTFWEKTHGDCPLMAKITTTVFRMHWRVKFLCP